MITGGGRGIGRALAQGFINAGARVVVLTRSEPPPLNRSDSERDRYLAIIGDVTIERDVQNAVTESLRRFNGIDILINNAGINEVSTFIDADFDRWARIIDVNLKGTALCTQKVLPLMVKARYGRIVNIVSRSAEDPVKGRTAYSASKAAVITFTKVLAQELHEMEGCDILVNGLIPGSTRTNMQPAMGQDADLVYPYCLTLATLPPGGPNGRFFRKGRDYSMYAKFNSSGCAKDFHRSHWPSWLRR